MKQKYKVFINDKEIVFQDQSDPVVDGCIKLGANLISSEILFRTENSLPDETTFNICSDDANHSFNKFIANFPVIRAAGGIVRKSDEKGSLLMIFRLGKWDLPKGKIDEGEDSAIAAVREVSEECGISDLKITGNAPDTFHIYKIKDTPVLKITNWYHMISSDLRNPEPQTAEGITDVKWVDLKEIPPLLPLSYKSIGELIKSTVLN